MVGGKEGIILGDAIHLMEGKGVVAILRPFIKMFLTENCYSMNRI